MNRYLALQAVVNTGSFTKAARMMGCTQSTMSQMIASLEQELSIRLLNRSRQGAELTPEGRELYPMIESYIRQYHAVHERADEINNLEKGVVRVGTLASITCHWMPDLIRGFQRMYPKVQFLFHQGDYTSIHDWIKSGEVDFGFVTPEAVPDLETVVLKNGEMLAILPSDHRLAHRESIRLEEIAGDPFILLEEGHFSEPMNAFHAAGLEPNIKYRIHDDYAIMTMVEAGLAVSIVAGLVLRKTSYDIARVPLDPPVERVLALGWRDWNSMPIASKRFVEYIRENVAKMP